MTRTSIEIDSFVHLNPIPAASRCGPLIESSIISPYNEGTRDLPDTVEQMISNLFLHMSNMLSAADASWDHIVKITFFAANTGDIRDLINAKWLEVFPDPDSRPARHTMKVLAGGDKPRLSCVFTAYVHDSV